MTKSPSEIVNQIHKIDLHWCKVPKNEKDRGVLEDALEKLMDTDPENPMIKVIAGLISKYEDKNVDIPESSGGEALEFLMKQHGHKQVDLIDIFGNQGNVSQVLNKKRGLSLENIRKLCDKYKVNADVFI